MIGLELEDARVIAVRVDNQGAVLERAQAEAGGDLGAAAIKAASEVQGTAAPAGVGVAAVNTDSPAIASAIAALSVKFGPSASRSGPAPSGAAAAAAEAWTGAARGVGDSVYFGVAQHATSGCVRNGVAITGARGRALSVGWLSLNPVEREDYRKIGCLEAEVAAAGIVRRMIWRIKAGDRSRVQDVVGEDLTAINVDHILAAAREGDGVSVSVIRDTAKYLGMAAANLVAIADPEMLVLGGIMASSADLLIEPIRAEIGRRLPKPMIDALRIETSTLGGDAAAIGAARLVAAALP
jgi:hypothetical protein